jgi:hypothetical protein
MQTTRKLNAHEIRKIAVEARRDPRSVVAVIAGTAAPMTEVTVKEAAQRLGIKLPIAA